MLLKLLLICLSLSLTVFGADYQGRIVNGTDAEKAEFPFIVSLRRVSSGRHSCGASLLNRSWVLTAAHCVARALPTMLNIQFGTTVIMPNSTENVANVSRIFVHEGYDPYNKYIHDIALLKLMQPITFSDQVQAVKLPEAYQLTPENTSASLIGWGLNKVSLRKSSDGTHFCAGTIIAPRWILTAAHCFTYIKEARELFIQSGSISLNPRYPNKSQVTEIIQHEGYNPTIIVHDIALLKLERPLNFSENVESIKLQNGVERGGEELKEGQKVKLLGWGLNETIGTLQEILQQVELELVDLVNCRRRLNSFLHASNLCAGSGSAVEGVARGQCSGDSGGPLLLHHDGIVSQIGIVSWSLKPCAVKPGVLTKVAVYQKWIQEKIKHFR